MNFSYLWNSAFFFVCQYINDSKTEKIEKQYKCETPDKWIINLV